MDRQPSLESGLVRLRPLRPEDFDALLTISSDPLLWEQHPAKERSEPDGFRIWFEQAIESGGALVVEDRETGEVIGTSRFHGYDPDLGEVEIGWTFLSRARWGGPWNGEMKRLMLDHAFGSVQRVSFHVHEANMRSQKAVEKLGATLTGDELDAEGRGRKVVYHLSADDRPS